MTIKDIAKNCSVSVSTVSRVLNQHPDVSEEVRQRVLDEVERCAYIPNNSARDLVKTRSDAIGVIVRGNGNLFFSSVLKTVSDEIERYGYTMVLHYIGSDADEVKAGAILDGIPFVCCSYTNYFGSLDEKDYSSVSIDDYATAYRATEELIRRGHRRIAAVIPSRDDRSISELRYRGFVDAMKANGIEPDENLIEETGGCFEMPESYEGTCRLLKRTEDFTAVFMLSDTTAMAAMKALEDHGKRIPQDVSVIAIDGLNVSEYAIPTLTTMIQPAEEMGSESVRILMNMLKDPAYTRHKLLDAPLREGASVRSI